MLLVHPYITEVHFLTVLEHDVLGETALHYCSMKTNEDVARVLLFSSDNESGLIIAAVVLTASWTGAVGVSPLWLFSLDLNKH